MNEYNFLNLSPYEFEILSRDLLQEHFSCHIESFSEGKDKGIDLRCTFLNSSIIQCKRYKDFSSLYHNLVKEVEKVKELSPEGYFLITSVGMTPDRKDKIISLFNGYIKKTEDIFGKEDINNLLGKYKNIELNHFKLWLSSVNVLQNIINRNIVNQSQFALEEIQEKIKIYVQNKSFFEAISLLEKNKYIIISGTPGIGKTTLAEILVYSLLARGTEDFIYLADSIVQGYKMYVNEKSQVFFFDDFLGRNFLENSIKTNEEKQILKFISKISRSNNKYIIFTTREYILNQAQQKFDLFDEVKFVKCIIDLSKYTNLVRAQILYNHLFFNNAPYEFVNEIYSQNQIFKIIEHKNYNPRIIETLTQKKIWEGISKEEFPCKVIENLDKPELIWKHAFENSISDYARLIMYVLVLFDKNIEYNQLYNEVLRFLEKNGEKYSTRIDSILFKSKQPASPVLSV